MNCRPLLVSKFQKVFHWLWILSMVLTFAASNGYADEFSDLRFVSKFKGYMTGFNGAGHYESEKEVDLPDSIHFVIQFAHSFIGSQEEKLLKLLKERSICILEDGPMFSVRAEDAGPFFEAIGDLQKSNELLVPYAMYTDLVAALTSREYLPENFNPNLALALTPLQGYQLAKASGSPEKALEIAQVLKKKGEQDELRVLLLAIKNAKPSEKPNIVTRIHALFPGRKWIVDWSDFFREFREDLQTIKNAHLISGLLFPNSPVSQKLLTDLEFFVSDNPDILTLEFWSRNTIDTVGGQGVDQIVKIVRESSSLEELILEGQRLEDKHVAVLRDAALKNRTCKLRKLSLANNFLTEASIGMIQQIVDSKVCPIQDFNLNLNKMSGDVLRDFYSKFKK